MPSCRMVKCILYFHNPVTWLQEVFQHAGTLCFEVPCMLTVPSLYTVQSDRILSQYIRNLYSYIAGEFCVTELTEYLCPLHVHPPTLWDSRTNCCFSWVGITTWHPPFPTNPQQQPPIHSNSSHIIHQVGSLLEKSKV